MPAEDDKTSADLKRPTTADQPKEDETLCFSPTSSSLAKLGENRVQVGQTLGKYRLISLLGQGGMGVVYLAHDPAIERDVAIKVLSRELAADESSLQRFKAEARATGKLNHPNVVSIYEVSQQDNIHYLVMELVPKGSIREELDRKETLSVLDATRIVADACKGLAAAHDLELIHRDVKPANLLRAGDGSVKVTDFGLAKQVHPANGTEQVTRVGQILGTPHFMSPEQCEGEIVDARSDIYSLGATYYCLLSGKNPYADTGSAMRIMYMHCHGDILDPTTDNPTIPKACSHIIARAMAKSPADRYRSMREMLIDCEAVIATLSGVSDIQLPSRSGIREPSATKNPDRSVSRRSLVTWIAAGGFLMTALVLLLVLWQPPKDDPPGKKPINPVPPPVANKTPIKVGVLHSLSGSMRDSESSVVDMTLFAIEEINKAGGVLGRPVEAVVADGRSDWPTFAKEAARLITEEKVCTVFGCWTSASRKTVLPVFEKHDHLLIYPVQYEGLEESPYVFYMGPAPNQQIIPAVQWAVKEKNYKTFFLVGSDYVFPRSANAIIKDQLKKLGAKVVGEEYLLLGDYDVDPVIQKIVKTRPDMILNTINGNTNVPFFRKLRSAGIESKDIPTMSFSIGEHELRGFDVAKMAGDYAAWTYFQSLDTPANREFVSRFQKKFRQHVVTDPMEAAYVAVMMWAKAVEETGDTNPHKIRRAMLTQRFDSPGGALRIDANTQHCYKIPRIGRIRMDGQFDIIWSEPKAVRPDPYPHTRTAEDWKIFLHDLYTGWGNRWAAPEYSQ